MTGGPQGGLGVMGGPQGGLGVSMEPHSGLGVMGGAVPGALQVQRGQESAGLQTYQGQRRVNRWDGDSEGVLTGVKDSRGVLRETLDSVGVLGETLDSVGVLGAQVQDFLDQQHSI